LKAFVTVRAIVRMLCTRLATPVICIAIFEEPSFIQTIRDIEVFVIHENMHLPMATSPAAFVILRSALQWVRRSAKLGRYVV
jgi:hypothetical protein